MSVTKILFKQGSPNANNGVYAGTANVGEPLWHVTNKQLFVSDGTNAILIGPYSHPIVTVGHDSNSEVTTPTGTTYQKAAANSNYALSAITVDDKGHIQSIETVALPSAGTSVSGANNGTNWTSITIGGDTYAIPAAVSGINDGTNWTSITIGSDVYAIPSGGGGGSSQADEIVSASGTAISVNGQSYNTTKLKVVGGTNEITLKSEATSSGTEGSVISFTSEVGGLSVTAKVEVIFGGTWS